MDVLMSSVSHVAGFVTAHWFTVAAATIVPLLLYFFGTRETRKLKAAFGDMPGPKPWPFLGGMPDAIKFKGQMHLLIDHYYKEYGRQFPFSFFGMCTLNVADPEMVRQVLVKDFDSFHDRVLVMDLPDPLDKMLGLAKGNTWKRIRNTLTPTFSAHKMKLMVPLMNEACNTLMRKLSEVADSGKSFDIAQFYKCLVMDIILSTAFGVKSNCQTNPDDPLMAKGKAAMKQTPLKQAISGILLLLPFGNKVMQLLSKWLFSAFFDLSDVAKGVIDFRKTDPSTKRMDMLELMLNAKDPETNSQKLLESEVLAQCLVFVSVGYETTSTTLALTCYHLAMHPEVQRKLQMEIDEVFPNEDQVPSYDTVRELAYLDMVISETLRLFPTAAFLSRKCMREIVLNGVKIPKDTGLWIPVYSIHRDPEFYPDPEKFDPERFSADGKQSRDQYTYLPFGHGPHSCIAVRFAQLQMKLVLARVVKKYRFEVDADAGPPDVQLEASLGVPKGVMLKIASRQ